MQEDSPLGHIFTLAMEEWRCINAVRLSLETQLGQVARALYLSCPTPKPEWEQLSEITKSVWIGYAKDGQKPADDLWECTLRSITRADRLTFVTVTQWPLPKPPRVKVAGTTRIRVRIDVEAGDLITTSGRPAGRPRLRVITNTKQGTLL